MAEAVLHRMHSPLVTGLGTAAWSSWGYGPRRERPVEIFSDREQNLGLID
jgi:hypothetical protein